MEFATASLRVGGSIVGDLGDLVANGADRAAGGVNERVDRRFSDDARTTRSERRSSGESAAGLGGVVNRAIDGCVDVVESAVSTFENAYDRQRRSGTAASAGTSDGEPISDYDTFTAEQIVTRIEEMTAADQVRDVLAYEERNKGRKTVTAAAQVRFTNLVASEPVAPESGG